MEGQLIQLERGNYLCGGECNNLDLSFTTERSVCHLNIHTGPEPPTNSERDPNQSMVWIDWCSDTISNEDFHATMLHCPWPIFCALPLKYTKHTSIKQTTVMIFVSCVQCAAHQLWCLWLIYQRCMTAFGFGGELWLAHWCITLRVEVIVNSNLITFYHYQ